MKVILLALLAIPQLALAQTQVPGTEEYVRAKVIDISDGIATLEVLEGKGRGDIVEQDSHTISGGDASPLRIGETVIVNRTAFSDGRVTYVAYERYRLPALLVLTGVFFLLGIVLGGRIGFTALLGLSASIGVLMLFVVPQIIQGSNPLAVSLIGSALIACTALYLAHGFNRRTTLALLSTVITLTLSTILALIFVSISKLFGLGSEEAMFIQTGFLQAVDLRGLLLGGIIIGALGVLDDITTAQTAAIDELSKANHNLGYKELFAAGTSIGREHIASLINTLALAYVGASLPILLLFFVNENMPWWVIVNSEFVAEEVVRTLVGSSSLLLAVPISTYIAAKAFANGNHTNAKGHAHVH